MKKTDSFENGESVTKESNPGAVYFSDYIYKTIPGKMIQKIESMMGKHDIGLLTVRIAEFYSLVGIYGEESGCLLLELLRRESGACYEQVFRDRNPVISVNMNEMLFFIRLEDDEIPGFSDLCFRYRIDLKNRFNIRAPGVIGRHADLRVGHARMEKDQSTGFYKNLFKVFCIAKRNSEQSMYHNGSEFHRNFMDILENNRIEILYQPVLDFETGETLGWEALARGPKASHFHKPALLFGYASETGNALKLDWKCIDLALCGLGKVWPSQRLFVNIHADTMSDPSFTPESMSLIIEKHGLKPENIVLEYSEIHSSYDFNSLVRKFRLFKNPGFGIAIDDVGAGRDSLRFISRINPDFIKLDTSMTIGIDGNPIKRIMTETIAILAEKIDAGVIAEGVETAAELKSLIPMGVQYGQGYYISMPANPKAPAQIELPKKLMIRDRETWGMNCLACAGKLVHSTVCVSPGTPVRKVKKRVAETELSPMGSVVVVEREKPAGLLMNYALDNKLGTLYGVSLHYNRPVSLLMDTSPLIVEAADPVEKIAKAAMKRESEKIYDDIVVTEKGRYIGVISVQQMLDVLAKIRVEMAKGANPLTGLPGNIAIERVLNRHAEKHIPASLIYIDLDNFKAYNDVYGFENGDRIILYTADILNQAVGEGGSSQDFIGHVGGDDFIIITTHRHAESVAGEIVKNFPKGVREFYTGGDFERGFIVGKGRDGTEKKHLIISVSVGIVDCFFKYGLDMDSLSRRMASIKKQAKSIVGNSYVRNGGQE